MRKPPSDLCKDSAISTTKESGVHSKNWQRLGVAGTALVLSGCMATQPFGSGRSGDPEPLYKVANRAGGFTISTEHLSRQTDQHAAESACKRGLIASANDLAKSQGRAIEPLDEKRVRANLSRDMSSGLTKCEASAAVTWAR